MDSSPSQWFLPLQCFNSLPQRVSAWLEVLVSMNQESGGNGGIVPVNSFENSSTTMSSSVVSPWSDSTSKDPTSIMPNGTFCEMSCSSPSHFPFYSGCRIWVFHLRKSWLCNGQRVTTKTCFVAFALPSTFSIAFVRIVPRFGEDFLAVSDLQTVQFSVFTFSELVTAGLFVQIFLSTLERDHGCGC